MSKKKFTSAVALEMAQRVEDLQRQIEDIYADITINYVNGSNSGKVLRELISERKTSRDATNFADDLLRVLDVDVEDEDQ